MGVTRESQLAMHRYGTLAAVQGAGRAYTPKASESSKSQIRRIEQTKPMVIDHRFCLPMWRMKTNDRALPAMQHFDKPAHAHCYTIGKRRRTAQHGDDDAEALRAEVDAALIQSRFGLQISSVIAMVMCEIWISCNMSSLRPKVMGVMRTKCAACVGVTGRVCRMVSCSTISACAHKCSNTRALLKFASAKWLAMALRISVR